MTCIIKNLANEWGRTFSNMAIGTSDYHLMPNSIHGATESHQSTGIKAIKTIKMCHPVAQHFTWCHAVSSGQSEQPSQLNPMMTMCLQHTLQGINAWIHPTQPDHRHQSLLRHDLFRYQMGLCIQQFNAIAHDANKPMCHTKRCMLFIEIKQLLSQLSPLHGAKGLLNGGIRDLYWFWTHLTTIAQEDSNDACIQ